MSSPTPSNSPSQSFMLPPHVQSYIKFLEGRCASLEQNFKISYAQINELEFRRDELYRKIKNLEAKCDELEKKNLSFAFDDDMKTMEIRAMRMQCDELKRCNTGLVSVNHDLRAHIIRLDEKIKQREKKDFPYGHPFKDLYNNAYGNIGE